RIPTSPWRSRWAGSASSWRLPWSPVCWPRCCLPAELPAPPRLPVWRRCRRAMRLSYPGPGTCRDQGGDHVSRSGAGSAVWLLSPAPARWFSRVLPVVCLTALSVLLGGCGYESVSAASVQRSGRDGLATQGIEPRSVSCPEGLTASVGERVVCEVDLW